MEFKMFDSRSVCAAWCKNFESQHLISTFWFSSFQFRKATSIWHFSLFWFRLSSKPIEMNCESLVSFFNLFLKYGARSQLFLWIGLYYFNCIKYCCYGRCFWCWFAKWSFGEKSLYLFKICNFLFMFISSSVWYQWSLTHFGKLYNFFVKFTFCWLSIARNPL